MTFCERNRRQKDCIRNHHDQLVDSSKEDHVCAYAHLFACSLSRETKEIESFLYNTDPEQ